MKRILAGILTMGMLLGGSALAEIYKYVDDNGQINYTNDLSSVPVNKLEDITELEEYKSKTVPPKAAFGTRRTSPPLNDVKPSQKDLIKKKREKLETEYNALLKEKEDLDNNKSFQKRRKKKNRTLIKNES